jgi:CAAX protease family protein
MEWGLALALLAGWLWGGRPLPELGVVLPEGTGAWWTVLVCVAGIVFYVQQARTVAVSPDAQASLRKELESQPNVRMILPATVREARVFVGLSITAGICEEVLYRGYLLWYLQSLGLGRGAVVVAIVAFGITHSFQGIRGIIGTGIMGAVFMGVYLLTGSLVAPIVLHATVDLANGLMAYRFFQRTETAASSSPDLRGSHDHPDVPGSEELRE